MKAPLLALLVLTMLRGTFVAYSQETPSPTPAPGATPPHNLITDKLHTIIIARFTTREANLEECVEYLAKKNVESDPGSDPMPGVA